MRYVKIIFISEGIRSLYYHFLGGDRLSKHSNRAHTKKAEPAAFSPDSDTVREMPQERRTFKKLQEQYGEFSRKRPQYIKYGLLSIFIIPIVFLVLMFSLESKLIFLVLWIISLIACAVFLIVVEYKDYWYRQLLGLNNEKESENTEEPEDCPPLLEPDGDMPEKEAEKSKTEQTDKAEAENGQKKQEGKKTDDGPEKSAEPQSKAINGT